MFSDCDSSEGGEEELAGVETGLKVDGGLSISGTVGGTGGGWRVWRGKGGRNICKEAGRLIGNGSRQLAGSLEVNG